jgi:hypothetical protein
MKAFARAADAERGTLTWWRYLAGETLAETLDEWFSLCRELFRIEVFLAEFRVLRVWR